MTTHGPRPPTVAHSSSTDPREHLKRLERHDWWRWMVVIAVTLALTAGVFFLSLPALRRSYEEQRALDLGVNSLFAIVLIFDVFALYQQVVISRLRRELTKQVAMSAALEMLRPPDPEVEDRASQQRRFSRFHFDQRVSVTYTEAGKQRRVYGRTSDISEGGLGAVIPESLEPGAKIAVEVALGTTGNKLAASGVVRYRRGFHHCIEFVDLPAEQAQQIQAACAGAKPALNLYENRWAVTEP